MSFYKTDAWKERRAAALRRDRYLCQECKRYGKKTEATTVHHIIPMIWCLIHNKTLALALNNLVSLCGKCHNKMHDRDSDKLTALGLLWVKKLGQMGLDWIDKYSKDY